MINQNNSNNNYLGINNFDKNQLKLINSIIEFYKQNDNDMMNFEYPNQIKAILNLLNPNYSGFKYQNGIEDPLHYIKEPKKIIKFVNSNYIIYDVSIPKSITKYDLYTIAQKYKYFKFSKSNVLLIHMNNILNKDETSIECISDNDKIIIIEPRNYPDNSYYESLTKNPSEKQNFFFSLPQEKKK